MKFRVIQWVKQTTDDLKLRCKNAFGKNGKTEEEIVGSGVDGIPDEQGQPFLPSIGRSYCLYDIYRRNGKRVPYTYIVNRHQHPWQVNNLKNIKRNRTKVMNDQRKEPAWLSPKAVRQKISDRSKDVTNNANCSLIKNSNSMHELGHKILCFTIRKSKSVPTSLVFGRQVVSEFSEKWTNCHPTPNTCVRKGLRRNLSWKCRPRHRRIKSCSPKIYRRLKTYKCGHVKSGIPNKQGRSRTAATSECLESTVDFTSKQSISTKMTKPNSLPVLTHKLNQSSVDDISTTYPGGLTTSNCQLLATKTSQIVPSCSKAVEKFEFKQESPEKSMCQMNDTDDETDYGDFSVVRSCIETLSVVRGKTLYRPNIRLNTMEVRRLFLSSDRTYTNFISSQQLTGKVSRGFIRYKSNQTSPPRYKYRTIGKKTSTPRIYAHAHANTASGNENVKVIESFRPVTIEAHKGKEDIFANRYISAPDPRAANHERPKKTLFLNKPIMTSNSIIGADPGLNSLSSRIPEKVTLKPIQIIRDKITLKTNTGILQPLLNFWPVGSLLPFKHSEPIKCMYNSLRAGSLGSQLQTSNESKPELSNKSKTKLSNESKTELTRESKPKISSESKTLFSIESETQHSGESKTQLSSESKTYFSIESKTQLSNESKTQLSSESTTHSSVESRTQLSSGSTTHFSVESKTQLSNQSKTQLSSESKTLFSIESKAQLSNNQKNQLPNESKIQYSDESEKELSNEPKTYTLNESNPEKTHDAGSRLSLMSNQEDRDISYSDKKQKDAKENNLNIACCQANTINTKGIENFAINDESSFNNDTVKERKDSIKLSTVITNKIQKSIPKPPFLKLKNSKRNNPNNKNVKIFNNEYLNQKAFQYNMVKSGMLTLVNKIFRNSSQKKNFISITNSSYVSHSNQNQYQFPSEKYTVDNADDSDSSRKTSNEFNHNQKGLVILATSEDKQSPCLTTRYYNLVTTVFKRWYTDLTFASLIMLRLNDLIINHGKSIKLNILTQGKVENEEISMNQSSQEFGMGLPTISKSKSIQLEQETTTGLPTSSGYIRPEQSSRYNTTRIGQRYLNFVQLHENQWKLLKKLLLGFFVIYFLYCYLRTFNCITCWHPLIRWMGWFCTKLMEQFKYIHSYPPPV